MTAGKGQTTTAFHPTWWMLIASILAAIMLFYVSPTRNPAIVLVAAITASAYILRIRLPEIDLFAWIIRLVAFLAIALSAPESSGSLQWYFDQVRMTVIGMMLQTELALQHFLSRPGRMRLGNMLALTSGIFLCGCTTTEPGPTMLLAPVFMICLLAIIQEFRPRLTTSPAMNSAPPPRTGRKWILHGSALCLALTLGFFSAHGIRILYDNIYGYGSRFLQDLISMRQAGGISGNSRLQPRYNLGASNSRTLKIHGANSTMHLRGLAFDTYENEQWLPYFDKRPFGEVQLLPPAAEARTITIDRLEDSLDLLYLPLNTAGIATPPQSLDQMESGASGVLRSVTKTGEMMRYSFARPQNDAEQGLLCKPLSEDERRRCLAASNQIDSRVREIAQSLAAPTAQQTIDATVAYLRANHKYSLVSQFDGEPISDFLLQKKNAHCQFFASSCVMLLRMNGIPCRYVTGYLAHEAISADTMVVRGRDAHAWVEVWLDGLGWITVDPTPPGGSPESADPVSWYQRVKDSVSDMFSAVSDFFRSLKWRHIAVAGGALVVVALSYQAIKLWRSRKTRPIIRHYSFPDEQFRRLAVEFEVVLKRLGDPPSGSATWSEHLATQKAQTRRAGKQLSIEAAMRFVHTYNRTRFGRPDEAQLLKELKDLLEKVKESS